MKDLRAPGFVFVQGILQVKLPLPQRRNANENQGGAGGCCVGARMKIVRGVRERRLLGV